MSKATITIDYYKAFGFFQNLPSLGLPALIRPPPIWRVLNKLRCERLPSNEALQWAILRVIFCHNAVRVNFKHHTRGRKFTMIVETLIKACSELVVLEVRVSFPCPMLSVLTSWRTLTIKPADMSENTVVSASSFAWASQISLTSLLSTVSLTSLRIYF